MLIDLLLVTVYDSFSILKRGNMDSKKSVSGGKSKHHPSSAKHKVLQKSSTLNRKFVKKPAAKPKVLTKEQKNQEDMARRKAIAEQMNRKQQALLAKRVRVNVQTEKQLRPAKRKVVVEPASVVAHPTVAKVNARVAAGKAATPRQLSAQELKERAIEQALRRVATVKESETIVVEEQMTEAITKKRRIWHKRKLVVALSMAVVSIGLLGCLVHLNLPDLSVRVAAMQVGIESAYPSYVPKGYRMDGLVAENNGKITMNFSHKDGSAFTLAEERSSWDSTALLSQFVTPNWGEDYLIMKEQGLTVYVSGSDAVWVTGGVFYYIDDAGDGLTRQQVHDIALSL